MRINDERTARDILVIDDTRAAQTITSSSLAIQPTWDNTHLIHFFQVELAIPAAFISLALRRQKQDPAPLPMILWRYGLISTEQLEQTFNWLEHG